MTLFLCYVFPPLAVLLMGRPFSAVLNFFLWGFGFYPGIRHALVLYADHKFEGGVKRVTRAINRPQWTEQTVSATVAEPRKRRPKPEPAPVIESAVVGRNGTQFRAKR